jgi:hypothetical protein
MGTDMHEEHSMDAPGSSAANGTTESTDPGLDLTLDGNAAAGILYSIFGVEVTASPGRCAHCGTVSVVATMRAYTRGPGVVLRCPACEGVVLRIVETPKGRYVDARGAASLWLARAVEPQFEP